MLTEQENQTLTQVGPGTPGGELLRRYWHPVAVTTQLAAQPTRRVRLLGEDLVLYRDRAGQYGLIEAVCAHRRVDLFYGIPEAHGLRCPYHGWLYDEAGQCLAQPYEQAASEGHRLPAQPLLRAYPVEELGGLLWAYLGPAPAPLLPRWEPLVREHSLRDVGVSVLPCNWLQIMENSLDPVHSEWLHGAFTNYSLERQGLSQQPPTRGRHRKISFDLFEHGIIKRRLTDDHTEEDNEWKRGHPIVFPYALLVGPADAVNFQFRVPMDDTHTLHLFYTVNTPGGPVEPQAEPTVFAVPIPTEDAQGVPQWEYLDTAPGQDIIAWITQGAVARREKERLGPSDAGLLLFRKLLADNIKKVQQGQEPMNVFRDPATNVSIPLPMESDHSLTGGGPAKKYSPLTPEIRRLFLQAQESAGAR